MKNPNFQDPTHSKEIDLMGLMMAKQMPGVKMYCLVKESALAEYLPLAEIQNNAPMIPENKAEDAIKDFLTLPRVYSGGKIARIFQALDLGDEYKTLKKTFAGQIVRDVWLMIQSIMKILAKLLARLLYKQPKKEEKNEK